MNMFIFFNYISELNMLFKVSGEHPIFDYLQTEVKVETGLYQEIV